MTAMPWLLQYSSSSRWYRNGWSSTWLTQGTSPVPAMSSSSWGTVKLQTPMCRTRPDAFISAMACQVSTNSIRPRICGCGVPSSPRAGEGSSMSSNAMGQGALAPCTRAARPREVAESASRRTGCSAGREPSSRYAPAVVVVEELADNLELLSADQPRVEGFSQGRPHQAFVAVRLRAVHQAVPQAQGLQHRLLDVVPTALPGAQSDRRQRQELTLAAHRRARGSADHQPERPAAAVPRRAHTRQRPGERKSSSRLGSS
eukprot:scaffold1035_cov374-Prasinococcus_capsulatus_cf.AAC.9